jgi:hypothetical protein
MARKAVSKVVKLQVTNPTPADPLNVNARLYRQISVLLEQMEDPDAGKKLTVRERIAALTAIGRIQVLFVGLRKEKNNVGSGSSVKKYSGAFAKPDAASRGAADTGPAEPPDDWFERAGFNDDGGDDLGSED